jgi:hypothetical protein
MWAMSLVLTAQAGAADAADATRCAHERVQIEAAARADEMTIADSEIDWKRKDTSVLK